MYIYTQTLNCWVSIDILILLNLFVYIIPVRGIPRETCFDNTL